MNLIKRRGTKKKKMKLCNTCQRNIKIKAKGMCQNCWHKYKRRNNLNFFLRTRYSELVQRCIQANKPCSKYYYGLEYCTREEFLRKFIKDKTLAKLYKRWQNSNFEYRLCPSVDRIIKNKGYLIDNIQFIPHGENAKKDNESRLKVDVYDINGNFLSTHEYLNDAVRKYKVQQSNAWKVLNGQRRHTKKLIFKNSKIS